MSAIKKTYIIGGIRIPFARSGTLYSEKTRQELMSHCLKSLVEKYSLQNKELGEVCLGSVIKSVRDFNMARECTMESGLSPATPAYDLQRACGTSLEAVINVANKIALGQIEVGIAGGVDTNSHVPIELSPKFAQRILKTTRQKKLTDRLKVWKNFHPKELTPQPPSIQEPRTGLSMGESCEVMAKEWKISRAEQDLWAYESHSKAQGAYDQGHFNDLITMIDHNKKDNNIRSNISTEKLAKLKTCFDKGPSATLTAGNSSALTDGASCVLVCSEDWAKEQGLELQSLFTHSQVAAVNYCGEEGLLMAPAYAMAKMLKKANMNLQDFDFYEIHEAFSAQVLCTLKAWNSEKFCRERLHWDKALGEIDRSKINVWGGSVALGHPFAATGSRIVSTLSKRLAMEDKKARGVISVCTAGGMGITAIMENLK